MIRGNKLKNHVFKKQTDARRYFWMSRVLITVVSLLLPLALIAEPIDAKTLEVGPGRPYATIQSAANAAASGDIVAVYAGTYTGSSHPTSVSLYNTTPCTVVLENKSKITIRAVESGVRLNGRNTEHCAVYVYNSPGFILDNFEIYDYNLGASDLNLGVVYLYGSPSSTVKNNYIHGTSDFIRGEAHASIYVRTSNSSVMQNNIINVRGSGFRLYGSDDVVIESNTVEGQGSNDHGIMVSGSNPSLPGNRVTIRYNYFNNYASWGIWLRDTTDAKVYYNVIRNITAAAIHPYDYAGDGNQTENHKIYNNTIIGPGANEAFRITGQEGTEIRGNIIYNVSSVFVFAYGPSSGLAISHNLTYQYNTLHQDNFAGWVDSGGNRWGTNPRFLATGSIPSPYFRLSSDSPGVAAGYSHSLTSRDFDGASIPTGFAPNIGAFQSTSGSAKHPSPPAILSVN